MFIGIRLILKLYDTIIFVIKKEKKTLIKTK